MRVRFFISWIFVAENEKITSWIFVARVRGFGHFVLCKLHNSTPVERAVFVHIDKSKKIKKFFEKCLTN